jgi:tetratricopeptide (TPR) repeat protein
VLSLSPRIWGGFLSLDKSSIVEKAQKFTANGQLDKAIEEWQKLIRQTPNDGNIYNTIGDLQLKRSLPQKAVEAYLKGAEAFQGAGFELKTIAVYKKVIKIDPSRLDVYEKLADLNAHRGMAANATEEYHRIAKQYAKLGNAKAALLIYQKLADLDPENVQARIKLAEMCAKEGFSDQALEAYQKSLEFLRARNKPNEASRVLKEIEQLRPGFQETEGKIGDPASPEPIPSPSAESNLKLEPLEAEIAAPAIPEFAPTAADQSEVSVEDRQEQVLPPPQKDESSSSAVAQPVTPEEIQNRLTEAEVYIKYGLLEKATEQLCELLKDAPDHAEVYLRLKEIYDEEGNIEKSKEVGAALADLYGKRGELEQQTELLKELGLLGRPAGEPDKEGEESDEVQPQEAIEVFGQAVKLESRQDDNAPPDLPDQENGLFEESVEHGEAYLETGEAAADNLEELTPVDDNPDRLAQSFRKDFLGKDPQEPPSDGAEDADFAETGPSEEPLGTVESGYVDLSSLLDEPEDRKSLVHPPPLESELDTIFEEFQKSMHEQPSHEDVETHFNLGIAYREMGLYTEATNEFKQAMGGARYIDSSLMLSICYQQVGKMKESEDILRSLMTDSRCSEEQRLLIKYELGLILSKENNPEASQLFTEVYKVDPKFRDVARKLGKSGRGEQNEGKRKARISYL